MITLAEWHKIMPYAGARIEKYANTLDTAMTEFEINDNVPRQAAFLAQVAHESGELRYVREIASGASYEGRADLGNEYPGDGVRFAGRGFLQITGRANYTECSAALFGDDRLLDHPELLERPVFACRSAGWFWRDYKHLNELADVGNFQLITKRINGGLNGWAARKKYYDRALEVLS